MIREKVITQGPTRTGRTMIAPAEVLFLLLLPALAYLLLHPPLINQAGSIDPYVYTGYIHNMEDLLARYHLTYYSVRFGLILPARLFGLAFGFDAGYVIFRYVLALMAGIPLYALTKRNFGTPLALATYASLLISPFFGRALLWDHPDATAVPYLLASIGLLALDLRPLWIWATTAGILFGLAVHSNFFTVSIFGLFLGALGLSYLLHGKALPPLLGRFLWLCAGFVIVNIVGVLYYFHLAGVWDIYSPTKDIVVFLSRGGMQQWRTAGAGWIAYDIQVLLLPLFAFCSLVLLLVPGRTVVSTMLNLYVVAMTTYYYVYQFALKANILQLPYYFSYCLPAIFLALPVILNGLWNMTEQTRRRWLAAAMAVGFVAPWLLIVFAFDWRPRVQLIHFLTLATVFAGLFVACTCIRMPPNLCFALVSITTLLFGIVFDTAFMGRAYNQLLRSEARQTEQDVYQVAEQFMAAAPKLRQQQGGVRFWYNNRPGNLANSVQATYLWGYSRCAPAAADDPGMPYIGPFESAIFSDKTVKYLVLLGETEDENEQGMAALRKRDVAFTLIDRRLLSSGGYRIYLQTLQLTGH